MVIILYYIYLHVTPTALGGEVLFSTMGVCFHRIT